MTAKRNKSHAIFMHCIGHLVFRLCMQLQWYYLNINVLCTLKHSFLAYLGGGKEIQRTAFKQFSKISNQILFFFFPFCFHFLLLWLWYLSVRGLKRPSLYSCRGSSQVVPWKLWIVPPKANGIISGFSVNGKQSAGTPFVSLAVILDK